MAYISPLFAIYRKQTHPNTELLTTPSSIAEPPCDEEHKKGHIHVSIQEGKQTQNAQNLS
jgi:hypothetical protein